MGVRNRVYESGGKFGVLLILNFFTFLLGGGKARIFNTVQGCTDSPVSPCQNDGICLGGECICMDESYGPRCEVRIYEI